ncbi:MAG: type II toxin-antitoxin system HicA family toxin [Roseburia sp.]|nr:type II toxin-antitoxin system HicA family toxin [Roseburia sp.]
MNPRREAISQLEDGGYVFARHGANHDIYFNPETKITIPVKRHDFDEDDLRYILKEAKLDKKKGKRKDG